MNTTNTSNPHVIRDYIDEDTRAGLPNGCRRVVLGIAVKPEDGHRRTSLEIEVARSGSLGCRENVTPEPFTVCSAGYGSLTIAQAAAYADLLGTALDLARRLNADPRAPHGLPCPWHDVTVIDGRQKHALPESVRFPPWKPWTVRAPVFTDGHLTDLGFQHFATLGEAIACRDGMLAVGAPKP